MWQANISRTERDNTGSLNIIITYTNGVYSFDETVSTSKAQADDWLSNQVADRLNQLNALDTFEQALTVDAIITLTLSVDPDTQDLTMDAAISSDSSLVDSSINS